MPGPEADPIYQAYIRSLGFQGNLAENQAQQRQDLVSQQLGISIPEAKEQGVQQRRSISGGMEDRGMYRSGQHHRRLSESRAGEQRRVGSLQLAGAMDVAGITSQLAMQQAQQQAGGAEAYLDSVYRQILASQQNATTTTYPAYPAVSPYPAPPPYQQQPQQKPYTYGGGGGGAVHFS